jgi:sulfur-oxidizing protein SoxY
MMLGLLAGEGNQDSRSGNRKGAIATARLAGNHFGCMRSTRYHEAKEQDSNERQRPWNCIRFMRCCIVATVEFDAARSEIQMVLNAIRFFSARTRQKVTGQAPAYLTGLYNLFVSVCAMSAFALVLAPACSTFAFAQSDKTWESLRGDIVQNRELRDGSAFMALDAPERAEDAAIVPLAFHLKPDTKAPAALKSLTLVVDENPSPVVATFIYGPDSAGPAFETRVRINSYSYVRAIAEAEDGTLYMIKRFVKASGGCSAPALKDEEQAKADIGKMRMKAVPAASGQGMAAQLMIHHPNYSGLQMNQITRLYIPAHFVRDIEVKHDGKLVWKMEGGISISENPNFIFPLNFSGQTPVTLAVRAVDTEDKVFEGTFTLDAPQG